MSNDQYEDITQNGNVVKSAKLEIGGSFEGTLKAIQANVTYPDKKDLVMTDADGEEFTVWTSGSLNYAVQDSKFEVGRTYKVTRLENKQTKKGASRTQFQIQRLKENGTVAAPTENSARPKGKNGNNATKNA